MGTDDHDVLQCDYLRAAQWNSVHDARPNIFTATAVKNLAATKATLDSISVTFFLAEGTLLGWWRNCMPIPWDVDVDIGVMIDDWSPDIIDRMVRAGFTLMNTVGSADSGLTLSFERLEVRQDIHFYYRDGAHIFYQLWQGVHSFRYVYPAFELRQALAFGTEGIFLPLNMRA